ncbi:hypothetical protein ACNVED_13145 [Legionella sp. D16C41]|uniref:hypothetical protein n=1 Tax=Legionella sp. D16C41 TaxID=3402688 RepID=UPI003AF5695C
MTVNFWMISGFIGLLILIFIIIFFIKEKKSLPWMGFLIIFLIFAAVFLHGISGAL